MTFERNELNKNSKGGTELIMERLYSAFPSEFLAEYQIIPSRVRNLDESKLRIYYAHDLAEDPESEKALRANGGFARFHKIIFVSHWQRAQFLNKFPKIPFSKTAVIQNSILPIERHEKPKDFVVNLIYHTTPHRGLHILSAVFKKLVEEYGSKIHLDVYSSFEIYGWKERDEQFKEVFDELKANEHVTYHGFKPNEEIREALKKAHVFAYPSVWPETSCIALIEAMSAGCICVHPDFAALPETSANWTMMYPWHESTNHHAGIFYNALKNAIETSLRAQTEEAYNIPHLNSQKAYADLYYNWEAKKRQWEAILLSIKDEPRELRGNYDLFVYEA